MIGSIENEKKLLGSINNQLKYMDGLTEEKAIQKLFVALDVVGIIRNPSIFNTNVDDYYDVDDDFLYNQKSSLRIRTISEDNVFLTLKKELKKTSTSLGTVRDEYEIRINKGDEENEILKCFKNAFPNKNSLPAKKLRIITKRHEIPIETKYNKYNLCFDKYYFYSFKGSHYSDEFYEIEIESNKIDNGIDPQLSKLTDILENLFEYKSHDTSKYKRGVDWQRNKTPLKNMQFIILDISIYSLRNSDEQKTIVISLCKIVKDELKTACYLDNCHMIPTGDGLILIFEENVNLIPFLLSLFNKVQKNKSCTPALHHFDITAAVHYGPAYKYCDINGNPNYAGTGINTVCRIQIKIAERQVLFSEEYCNRLDDLNIILKDELSQSFNISVKHGLFLKIRNYFSITNDVGIPHELALK
ncbi:MAG: CYTH domain-containing protein [Eubacteriales bacterium]